MNEDEKNVVRMLGEVWNAFIALPDPHPCDHEDFCHHIHILQRHVMARLARRSTPGMFSTNTEEK